MKHTCLVLRYVVTLVISQMISAMKDRTDFLWVEKYRPKKIEDCILPESIKSTFQEFVDGGEIPNLLLAGPAGCGKTTIARALCEQLQCDYIVINGSDEGRFLDTVRNTAKNFASTVSLQAIGAKHKVIIIDELTTQPTTYSSSYGRILRHFITTADLFSPATIRTKLSNHSTPDVQSSSLDSQTSRDQQSPQSSSSDSKESWIKRLLSMMRKYWSN